MTELPNVVPSLETFTLAVTVERGQVVMLLERPVDRLPLPPVYARLVATKLLEAADRCEGKLIIPQLL